MDEILTIANPTIKEVLTKKMLPRLEADALSFKTLKEVVQTRESRPKFAGATLADSSDTFYTNGPNEANFEIPDTIVTNGLPDFLPGGMIVETNPGDEQK